MNDFNWSNQRRTQMTLAIFAIIVATAIIAAFATTIHRVDTRQTNSDLHRGRSDWPIRIPRSIRVRASRLAFALAKHGELDRRSCVSTGRSSPATLFRRL